MSVSLLLMVSSKASRLTLVRTGASFVYLGTCVVEQCGNMLAICGRVLVPGVSHGRNLIIYFRYTCLGVNQTLS